MADTKTFGLLTECVDFVCGYKMALHFSGNELGQKSLILCLDKYGTCFVKVIHFLFLCFAYFLFYFSLSFVILSAFPFYSVNICRCAKIFCFAVHLMPLLT
jgi:hypothetical protein